MMKPLSMKEAPLIKVVLRSKIESENPHKELPIHPRNEAIMTRHAISAKFLYIIVRDAPIRSIRMDAGYVVTYEYPLRSQRLIVEVVLRKDKHGLDATIENLRVKN